MADNLVVKRSLFRETLAALKMTAPHWWAWVLVFGLLLGALQIGSIQFQAHNPLLQFYDQHPEIKAHPETLKDNPQLNAQYMALLFQSLPMLMAYLGVYMLVYMVIEAAAFYIFAVMYMQITMPAANLRYNLSDFYYWVKRVSWKYTRPILWLLLPVIGLFFYMRSIVRYLVVTPLALLRQPEDLETSWALTKGKWWRLFGNQLAVALCLMVGVFFVSLIPAFLLVLLTHGTKPPAYQAAMALLQGMAMAFGTVTSALYCCVAYRILIEENDAKKSLPTH